MTKQEAFNIICGTLAAQGFEQSMSEAGMCLYRGENGMKCAAGALIPDECYSPVYEGKMWAAIAVRFGLADDSELNVFVMDCQAAHDYGFTPSVMREELTAIGQQFQLDLPASLTCDH